jgi:hypothetical protein
MSYCRGSFSKEHAYVPDGVEYIKCVHCGKLKRVRKRELSRSGGI